MNTLFIIFRGTHFEEQTTNYYFILSLIMFSGCLPEALHTRDPNGDKNSVIREPLFNIPLHEEYYYIKNSPSINSTNKFYWAMCQEAFNDLFEFESKLTSSNFEDVEKVIQGSQQVLLNSN